LIVDRDGTVIEDNGYLRAPEGVLLEGAIDALAEARDRGVALALATNQASIARGIITEELLAEQHAWLGGHIEFDGVYVCPHHPDDKCACRKPMPGLIEQAIRELDLDPARTLFVGDKVTDCEAGRAAGVEAVLVRTGNGAAQEDAARGAGYAVVDDLAAAVRAFLDRLDG
jgi:D-glycero-D-manno-heptose 1,7-bisphosphate phosphatase